MNEPTTYDHDLLADYEGLPDDLAARMLSTRLGHKVTAEQVHAGRRDHLVSSR